MLLTRLPTSVKALAPAKLNLFLEVLSRRNDGFHEIETLMTAITIFDTLHFTIRNEDRIRLTCSAAVGPTRARHGGDLHGQRANRIPAISSCERSSDYGRKRVSDEAPMCIW